MTFIHSLNFAGYKNVIDSTRKIFISGLRVNFTLHLVSSARHTFALLVSCQLLLQLPTHGVRFIRQSDIRFRGQVLNEFIQK